MREFLTKSGPMWMSMFFYYFNFYLADRNLIKIIHTEDTKPAFLNSINRIRKKADPALSLSEIASEVEAVRMKRYGK